MAIVTFIAILAAWEAARGRKNRRRKWVGRPRRRPRPATVPPTAANQLEAVMTAAFEARPIMSRAEASVFYAAERAVKRLDIKGRVMAQVCLGEILRSPDDVAYRAINSKRVDILLISNSGFPLAAIEYQGEGHYQGTAHARDAVKKAALQRAGIAYIEATPQHNADDIERDIARAMQARASDANLVVA
ncbi:DUF2726 domain-containing protein [Brevundimonas sp.]|uniref:DUF2726 domain-containing protein n=1 Tax=Brevundimonas sp. TaxID=1871086 RepID=UPI0025BE358C|nr:DUF2726 domain-containing protein [Brevundimonas sp.]